MKKIAIAMAALVLAMAGCQKEPQASNQQQNGIDSESVYVSFTIQALTTKSGTATEDNDKYASSDANPNYEIGKDFENTISTVDIVLKNGPTYISATATIDGGTTNEGADKETYPLKWVAKFNSSQLKTDTDYEIYVYANCSAKQDPDAISEEEIDAMTTANKFWMTNAYAQTVNFAEFSTNEADPTDLGDVFVERAMARFDYLDNGDYTIVEDNTETTDFDETVTITMTKAALINQSKKFYYLRRVSTDGTNTNWSVGGVETKLNYVVDTDWQAKSDGYNDTDAENFTYPLNNPSGWDWKSLPEKTTGNKENWTGSTHADKNYYFWQYAKENTIPGVENQVNGLSTGVVFKGEIKGDIVTAAAGDPIYVHNNILYGTWAQVKSAADKADAPEALKYAVSKCIDAEGNLITNNLAAAGFTQYTSEKDQEENNHYYTYYYYWNRHNDNNQNTTMGKMEFAVVRNNVYKLCIDNITKFGHPTPGGIDPDPIDPDDPDESGEYYFKVSVKVLPWVVRVNHIGF